MPILMPNDKKGKKSDRRANGISAERMARLDRALDEALRSGRIDSDRVDPEDRSLLHALFERASSDLPGLDQSVVAHRALSDGLAAAINDDEALHAGDRVGAFRLERCIGRGGMGTVYLARRQEGGFEQQVALKILSQKSSDPAAFQLFQRERDLLARLQHPGIARLIDGGMTQGWRPWFAMEYVDGQPIDRYARQRQLTVDARLALFIQACDALAHAHHQLILHRDLKPGNLLVDTSGQLRIVDFGLGRALDSEQAFSPDQTLVAGRLTPDYASPEQARGEAITVSSEVYQLGLVLYQLVCGQRPYRTESTNAWALAQSISQAIVLRPSDRCRQHPELAVEFSSSARQHVRRLRGDIDNIVLKAIARKPEDRYPSVEALASDLRRHRRQLPIEARTATRRYQLNRFIRRNRASVASSVALVLTLCGGLLVMSMQAADLARERDRVISENERSQRLIDSMSRMIRLSDADQSAEQMMTLGQRLEQYRDHIDRDLVDDSDARRQMLAIIGEAMSKVGYWDQAAQALLEAHAISFSELGPTHPESISIVLSLATARAFNGEFESADSLLTGTIDQVSQSRGQDATARADLLYTRGHLRTYHLADTDPLFGRGIEDLEQALDLYRRQNPGPNEDVAKAMHWLGLKNPDLDRRLDLVQQALSMTIEVHGKNHVTTASRTAELALIHDLLGQYDQAIEVARKAHALHTEARGPDHPQSLTILSNLAGSLRMNGDLREAVEIYRRVHEIRQKTLPDDHILLAFTAHGMGNTLRELGDLDESEKWLREALRLCLENASINEAVTRSNLSKTLEAKGLLAGAIEEQKLALLSYETNWGPEAETTLDARRRLLALQSQQR